MAHNIFRKGGIPVLASLDSDLSFPSMCSLVVKHDETRYRERARAAMELHFSMSLQGFDEEQPVHLVYEANNLMAGSMIEFGAVVNHGVVSPPQGLLNQVSRNRGTHLRLLSLHLRAQCIVRCPHSASDLAPQSEAEASFRKLVSLSEATRIHILFDDDWLHPSKASRFRGIVKHPHTLDAFGSEQADLKTNPSLRRTNWTVFSPAINTLSEAPPAYQRTPNKRRRQATSSPKQPSPKRPLLSPAPDVPFSPTEKATTTTASPSPSPRSKSPPMTGPLDFQEAVNNALITLLPDALQRGLVERQQQLVEEAVRRLLPGILERILPKILDQILPDILPRLLTVPPSSPSPLPSFSHSPSATRPQPPPTLHKHIRAQLTAHTDALAQQLMRDVFEHANDLRETTQVHLQEDLDEHRVDVTMLKEDGLRDVNRLFDEKLEEFRESATDIVESVETQTLEVYDAARARLDEFAEREKSILAKERDDLEQKRRQLKQRRHDQSAVCDRLLRATSLPLGL